MNIGTPPTVFSLNEKLRVVLSTILVIFNQKDIINTNFTYTSGLVPLTPLPGTTQIITPIVPTATNYYGQYFFKIEIHQQTHSDSRSISAVNINERT